MHFEANGTADIKLEQASRTRIEGVFATKLIEIKKALNTTVENALVERILIDQDAVRTRLDNVTVKFRAAVAGSRTSPPTPSTKASRT